MVVLKTFKIYIRYKWQRNVEIGYQSIQEIFRYSAMLILHKLLFTYTRYLVPTIYNNSHAPYKSQTFTFLFSTITVLNQEDE